MNNRAVLVASIALAISAHALAAQQITLGVKGPPGQPGMVVLAGRGLDSVRTIVQRDLLNSDRFTMTVLVDSLGTLKAPLDSSSIKGFGSTWAVDIEPAPNGVDVRLFDVATGTMRHQETRVVDLSGVGDTRLSIHRVSDLIVSWINGVGIAATRIAFKWHNGLADDAIWRIDSDGANLVRVTRAGIFSTPAWSPDGSLLSYSQHLEGRWVLYLQKLTTGTRTAVIMSDPGDNFGGNFSPDGRFMVFSHNFLNGGAAIGMVDVRQNCCARLLTTDRRNAENISGSYSPDGRHILYISNRTGTPQVNVMDDDGAGRDQLIPSDFGSNGRALDSYSPVWSPDGTKIVFSREVEHGNRQLFTAAASGSSVVQRTYSGLNDDASWAPDSRHVVFKSNRTGREQLWILDIESSATRQLTNVAGGAQFPAWSHALGTNP